MSKTDQPQELNIELNEDIAEGIYSNLSMVGHSSSEFIIDFIRLIPNLAKAKVKSRIVLSPQHAKRLMHILNENIKHYESKNGFIKDLDAGTPNMPLQFKGPKGQA